MSKSNESQGVGEMAMWKLTRIGKDPPLWRVSLPPGPLGEQVEVSTPVLISAAKMKRAVLDQCGRLPMTLPGKMYPTVLAALIDEAAYEERTGDAERSTAIADAIEAWLAASAPGSDLEDLARGPIVLEEHIVATLAVVRAHLVEIGETVDRTEMPTLLRACGFVPGQAGPKRIRVWMRQLPEGGQ